jgi:23S rRNA (pseudouridine1915-N3)-methyltransferase
MRVRVIAVGTRMPSWVRDGTGEYQKRLGSKLRVSLTEISPGARTAAGGAARAVAAEGTRLMAALADGDYVVALDERGRELTTRELAGFLSARLRDGRDLALLIGGADGFAAAVRTRADFTWSLSRLTLPHALVRVVLVEQLYRAQTILDNHPYHRE